MAIVSDIKEEVKAYTHRDNCRFCKSKNVGKVLDLGSMPLAGGFLDESQFAEEQFFPLRIYFCRECCLVQNLDVIDKRILFRNYFYVSSASQTGVLHFTRYADDIYKRFGQRKENGMFVVEIGSNDGVLLEPLKRLGCRVLGVEPAENVAKIAEQKGLEVVNKFFTKETARDIVTRYGKADVIAANNVFAHIDDLDEVMLGIKHLLTDDGVFVFEVHYLLELLEKMQYDTIYHEHFCYDSLLALISFFKRFDMEIFHVEQFKIHEGTIRVYTKNNQNKTLSIDSSVNDLLSREKKKWLDKEETYLAFAEEIVKHKNELLKLLRQIKSENKRIVGYGAAGRGNTLFNYCNIGTDIVEYLVDESKLRQGKFTPGTHIPIFPVEKFRKDNPDYVLLVAWTYKDEILDKEKDYSTRGGKFIIPLPKVALVEC